MLGELYYPIVVENIYPHLILMFCKVTTVSLLPLWMVSRADTGVETGPPIVVCGPVPRTKSFSLLMEASSLLRPPRPGRLSMVIWITGTANHSFRPPARLTGEPGSGRLLSHCVPCQHIASHLVALPGIQRQCSAIQMISSEGTTSIRLAPMMWPCYRSLPSSWALRFRDL